MIQLKSESELERMRVAGRHVGDILVWLRGLVEPGITTAEIDRAAHSQIEQRKLGSSFLGYGPRGAPPYPAVICTSVNEEIVHGIPGPRELKEGDVLKLDFGVIFEGFHGDSAVSIPVGAIDEKAQGLLDATRRALYAGIEQMREGNRLGDVSSAIQSVAEGEGYSVVRSRW
jgi:methionyl aminopeptidase